MTERRIFLPLTSLLLLLAVIFGVILLWQLRSLLLTCMIAVILASTLAPVVEKAEKMKIPRWLAVILVYLSIIALLTGAGLLIGPTVVQQIERLVRALPGYLEVLAQLSQALVIRFGINEPESLALLNQYFDLQALIAWALASSQQLLLQSLGVTRGLVGGVFNLFLAVLLSGYMLSGSQRLLPGLVSLFPYPWDRRLAAQVLPVSRRMGGYIQGRLLVSGILAIAVTLGLRILGISELALGLGVIAGFTNLIPFFGPVLGAVPALIVAVAQGGWTFAWVLLLFVIIQNVETYVLDPLLVGSSVRVAPLYQLLAVLGGAQVLGIIGALIVPPWVAGVSVLLENLYLEPKLLAEQQALAAGGNVVVPNRLGELIPEPESPKPVSAQN